MRCKILFGKLIESAAENLDDRPNRFHPRPVVELLRIGALVEELFTAVAFVPDVDEVGFRQGDQRALGNRRSPFVNGMGWGRLSSETAGSGPRGANTAPVRGSAQR